MKVAYPAKAPWMLCKGTSSVYGWTACMWSAALCYGGCSTPRFRCKPVNTHADCDSGPAALTA